MKNKKLIIIIVSIIILIILLGIGAYFIFVNSDDTQNGELENFVQVLEDETKVNISPKLTETKEYDGLEVTNLTLTESGNITKLLGTITNKTAEVKEEGIVVITFLDKQGNEMTTLDVYVKKLQPGESTQLNASTTFDYTNAYDIKITK